MKSAIGHYFVRPFMATKGRKMPVFIKAIAVMKTINNRYRTDRLRPAL
ncbi:hypothetical protein [Taibaiella sp. KBW10]|nr:hypothetical protein [Taibaiella sp. KBW10]